MIIAPAPALPNPPATSGCPTHGTASCDMSGYSREYARTAPAHLHSHPILKACTKLSRRPHRNLSSPQTQLKLPNPLQTLAINLSETWHSYPLQLTKIEVGANHTGLETLVPKAKPNPNALNTLPISPLNRERNSQEATSPPRSALNTRLWVKKYGGGEGGVPPSSIAAPASSARPT